MNVLGLTMFVGVMVIANAESPPVTTPPMLGCKIWMNGEWVMLQPGENKAMGCKVCHCPYDGGEAGCYHIDCAEYFGILWPEAEAEQGEKGPCSRICKKTET